MKSSNGSLSLVLLLSHLLVVSFTLTAAQTCYTTGNFTTNSMYGQNRNHILFSLSSNINATNRFYTATLGQGSDKVYALALCGGDDNVPACSDCVNSTAQTIINTCPNQKEAIMWAGGGVPECIVRYSNRSIFGVKEVDPYLALYATANISSNMDGINEIWNSFMNTIVTEAAMGSSKLKFSSKVKSLTGFEKIYALAQCTPDLSQSDCSECLEECLSYFRACCIGHGGIVYRPSCLIRSESYPIYDYYTTASPPAASPPGTSPSPPAATPLPAPTPETSATPPPAPTPETSPTPPTASTAPPPPSTNTTTGRAAPICYTTGNFTTNSKYGQNRNDILLSLSSNITATNGGFYKATLGQGSDKVYALALCGGDYVSHAETCLYCVDSIARTIKDDCPNQKESIMWADGGHGVPACIVRYSNRSIFGVKEVNPYLISHNIDNISSNMDGIDEIWNNFMNTTVTEAAMGSSKLKFSFKVKNLMGFEKIYALAQCTPDLSQSDCGECLEECLSSFRACCIGHGGIVYRPSCLIRSESYPIYENYTPASSPAPPPPSTNATFSSPAPLPPSTNATFSSPASTNATFSSPAPPRTSTNTTILTGGGYSSRRIIIIVVATVISVVVFFTFCLCFIRWKARKKDETIKEENVENEITTVQSLQFELGTIEAATNNFSTDNKIGEGGFGSVYKGTLSNGQEIAVKRLSSGSGQGAQEFKNEVVLVAKLQHRNLVRLLGFCMGGEEKILIYEFVPNKSLDYFLFDPKKQAQLDWLRRYKIIGGIARGMLYLHVDSRLRIIHRDLKASNVLLDENMDPKISDFGLARIVGVDQTRGITNRIVGTYGYMAPEYLIRGHFSTKSDVFSFGVLVLEIISGKKNNSFYQSGYDEDLLSYAWKHWRDGTPLELMDPTLTQSYSKNEVIRCIQIGLLCVQQDPADRPTMASIVLMLDSFLVSLPLPQQPAFFAHSRTESYMPVSKLVPSSVNEASITELYPR